MTDMVLRGALNRVRVASFTALLHDPLVTTLRGSSIDQLSFGAIPDAGLTREVVELSAQTHLPLRVLGYEGSTLVRRIDFSNVKLPSGDL
jgi:hypothetical protein